MIEIFDYLTQSIRIVWPRKANAWLQYNKLILDENGAYIKGRYIELEAIDKQSLIDSGLTTVTVTDDTTKTVYERNLVEAVTPTVEEVKEVKPKRKRRTKKEIEASRK